MTAFIHAADMLEYALDAAKSETPWVDWEFLRPNCNWEPLLQHPGWLDKHKYRRKPRIFRIGEYDVPEPMRTEPEYRSTFWAVNPFYPDGVSEDVWHCAGSDISVLANGMAHATKEAALIHAKALISLTKS